MVLPTNSHYLTYTFLFRKVGRMYFLNLGVKGLKIKNSEWVSEQKYVDIANLKKNVDKYFRWSTLFWGQWKNSVGAAIVLWHRRQKFERRGGSEMWDGKWTTRASPTRLRKQWNHKMADSDGEERAIRDYFNKNFTHSEILPNEYCYAEKAR